MVGAETFYKAEICAAFAGFIKHVAFFRNAGPAAPQNTLIEIGLEGNYKISTGITHVG